MSDEYDDEKLLIVRNKFLCCVPVPEIGLKEHIKNISWSAQAILLNYTIKNSLLEKYPIKIAYQKAFLKALIDILEQDCDEVHDLLYDTYCTLLATTDDAKFYYKHYCIDDTAVTLKENKNFISEGTTGLCSWQAALALAEYCLNNKQHFQQKIVLELGSGVGLVGITVAQHCQPHAIYLTDCHPKVLTVLAENVSVNITGNSTDTCEQIESVNAYTIKENYTVDLINSDTVPVQDSTSAVFDSAGTEPREPVNCHTIKETSSAGFDSIPLEDSSESGRCESVNRYTVKETVSAVVDSITVTDCGEPEKYHTIAKTLRAGSDSTAIVNISNPKYCDNYEPVNYRTVKDSVKQQAPSAVVSSALNNSVSAQHTVKFDREFDAKFDSSPDVLLHTVQGSTSVCVLRLPWESVLDSQCCSSIAADWILAADVVYDSSVFRPLCGAVKYFLDTNLKCKVIFACTERNSDTLNEFVTLLESNKFNIKELTPPNSRYFFWSTDIPIRLFMVSAV